MVNSNGTTKRKRAWLESMTRFYRTTPEMFSAFEALDVVTRQIATSPAINAMEISGRQFPKPPIFDSFEKLGLEFSKSPIIDATEILGRQFFKPPIFDSFEKLGLEFSKSPIIDATEILGRQFSKSPILDSFDILGRRLLGSPTTRALSVFHDQTAFPQICQDTGMLNRQLAASLVPPIENMSALVGALAPERVTTAVPAYTSLKPDLFTWFSPRPTVETDVGPQDLAAENLKFGSPVPEAMMRPFLVLFDRLITDVGLRGVSRKPFADGYCTYAVEQAWKYVSKRVKKKSGFAGKDGADLMRRVFSPEKPVLYFSASQSESGQNEQRGYMDIFAGAMTGIRNPRAHECELVDDPCVALEILILANHLLRKLRNAVRVMNLVAD